MIFQYPYTDLYNLNLDWIIKAIKEVQAVIGELGTVVNSVNGMTGDVQLTSEIINSIIGGVVNSFNGRAGNVTLTPQDVNDTLIDITYISDPGETISDYTQENLNQFYTNGIRVMVMVNSQGQPDRLYFLTMVGDDATPQQYSPTGAIAGVSSYNGQTGDVTGVSSFNGQSGAVTGVTSFNGQAGAVTGVNSVNGATGAVSLNAQNLPIAADQTATIASALAGKQPVLTFDSSPTAGSSNPVTSGGLYTALSAQSQQIETLNSKLPVSEMYSDAVSLDANEVKDLGAVNELVPANGKAYGAFTCYSESNGNCLVMMRNLNGALHLIAKNIGTIHIDTTVFMRVLLI